MSHPFTVILTGGIASGKTTVSDAFAELGAAVVDTDIIAREVAAPGTAGFEAVVEAFGQDIVAGGEIDRARLRERIFSDPAQRRNLEAILHPLIEAEARRRLRAPGDAPYIILVVPLLSESKLDREADRILVVDVDESVQLSRLTRRDGIDDELARRMIASQTSRADRLAMADDVIDNNGDLPGLMRQIHKLHQSYLAFRP